MLVLRRIDHSRAMARFYTLSLEPSLFGQTLLVRRWGRLGSYGRTKTEFFEAPAAAVEAMTKLAADKTRRGYSTVEPVQEGAD